ncbi:snurportin-1 [Lucilia cuprina]|uniref:snurportin-1 n=1 Tax=Lucilia cuprina TaxID=7375 RepID=UPI001F05AC4B|nr:snurportin-1 [Lucilia cuprina]
MFHNLYKPNINEKERQEIRRKELLQQQKIKRLEQQDEQRNLKDPHASEYKGKFYNKKRKINTSIENINLQLSEWLKEKPENFDDWLLVPCPKGQRCLVVAARGETKMFSKNKKYRMTFSSILPGGGILGSCNDYCILDCIYCKEMDIFYILDALHFSIPLVDCDAEFRFFWLKSKLNELDEFEGKLKYDNLKLFKLLENYDMSNEERTFVALQRYPLWVDNRPQLDGFLFYHKKSHYVYGTTPLVCWLFAFMLPDVLQMAVSRCYASPDNYCKQNPWRYMDEFDKRLKIKHCSQKEYPLEKNSTAMDEDLEYIEWDIDETRSDKDNELDSLLTAEKLLELEEGK